jgi:RHS repeat-associated core domain protein
MMRIVYYYAKKTGTTQHATTIGVDASTPKGTDANTLAYTLNDKTIRVLVKKGYFNKKLSQIYNMSSTLSHENFHTQIRGKSREEEIQVIMRQMQAPEFKKTTASFKEGTAGYLQKELQKLYKENNRIFNKYIEKASELLKANGVNSVPTYLNGGNEIQF